MGQSSSGGQTREYNELSADVIIAEREQAEEVAGVLRAEGFDVSLEAEIHPYLDARADLYAFKNKGPKIVVEVRAFPPTARVPVDTVQQVQHRARLLGRERRTRTVGLLVSTGRFTLPATDYAEGCEPRVYLAAPDGVPAALQRIAQDWDEGGAADGDAR